MFVCASCLWVVGERKTSCNANSDALAAKPPGFLGCEALPSLSEGAYAYRVERWGSGPSYLSGHPPRVGINSPVAGSQRA